MNIATSVVFRVCWSMSCGAWALENCEELVAKDGPRLGTWSLLQSIPLQMVGVNISKWTMLPKAPPNLLSKCHHWCAFVIAFCLMCFLHSHIAVPHWNTMHTLILPPLHFSPCTVLSGHRIGQYIIPRKFYQLIPVNGSVFFCSYEWKNVYRSYVDNKCEWQYFHVFMAVSIFRVGLEQFYSSYWRLFWRVD